MSRFEDILALYDSIPWTLAEALGVYRIDPRPRQNIDFFAGHRGFSGSDVPLGGIMIVGNNFSSVRGLNDYDRSPDAPSKTPTWRRLRLMVAASGVPLEDFWFTNYCHGAMDIDRESYAFPANVIKQLEFERVFVESVSIMRPRLVVGLGGPVTRFLRGTREIEERSVGATDTRLVCIAHPSAWVGVDKAYFEAEGRRIGLVVCDSNE